MRSDRRPAWEKAPEPLLEERKGWDLNPRQVALRSISSRETDTDYEQFTEGVPESAKAGRISIKWAYRSLLFVVCR